MEALLWFDCCVSGSGFGDLVTTDGILNTGKYHQSCIHSDTRSHWNTTNLFLPYLQYFQSSEAGKPLLSGNILWQLNCNTFAASSPILDSSTKI